MWRNVMFAAGATVVLVAVAIFSEIDFLIPYKGVLWDRHGVQMMVYLTLLFVNLFVLYKKVAEKLFLKTSGDKLDTFERQVRKGDAVEELAARLSAGK